MATLSNPDAAWWEIDGALFALGKAEPADIRANRGFIDQFAGHSEWYLREAAFWALVGVGGSITAEEFNKLTDIYAASVHVFERSSMDAGFRRILGTAHSAFACDQRVDSVRTFGASFNTIPVPPGYVDRSADHEAVHRTMMILTGFDQFNPGIHRYLVPDFKRYLETWEPGNQHADWLIVGSPWQPGILSVLATELGAYGKPVVEELERILAIYDSFPGGTAAQKQAIQSAVDLWNRSYDKNGFPDLLRTPELTAYYDFENDFDDATGAGNSTDNLLGIGASFSTDAPANGSTRSVSFNGSSVLVSNAYSADLAPAPDAYTIMFWVKAGDAAQPVADAPVISTRVLPAGGGAAEPAWQVDGPGSGGDPLTLRFNPGPCAGSNWVSPAATGAVAAAGTGAWHHVAFVVSNAGHPSFNGDAYSRTFVDGVEVGLDFESPWTDLRVGNSEGMLIIGGNTAGGGTSGFTGLLDDVALFSGVVSDNDIAAIAAGTQQPDDPLQGAVLPVTDPPVLGTPSELAVFADGALLNCQLSQASASVFVVWAYADQGETDLATWAGAPGGGGTGIGQYAPGAIPISRIITGLEPGQPYAYRFFATNAIGADWSPASGFTTAAEGTGGYQGHLVAYWPFDTFYETGDNPPGSPQGNHEGMFADLSGNNQTAYAADLSSGNYAPLGPGKFGNAFYSESPVTDSNDGALAVVPHSQAINFSREDFTISFWEKSQYRIGSAGTWKPGQGRSIFFAKSPYITDTRTEGFGLSITPTAQLILSANNSGNSQGATLSGAAFTYPAWTPSTPNMAPDSGAWVHRAMTGKYVPATDSYTIMVFENGVAVDWNGAVGTTVSVSNAIIDNPGDLTIGGFWRNGGSPHQHFLSWNMMDGTPAMGSGKAWIDDFAMWDVALTADDITDLAAGTSPLYVGGTSNLHAPVAADATFAITEGSPLAAEVGTVAASDADAGSVLTYAITGGNSAGLFAIDPASGLITVAGAIDFETAALHLLTVTVTDDGDPVRTDTAAITVNVINVPEDNAEVVAAALTGPGGPFEGQSDPAVIGFPANPDGDQWANALEVLFGFDAATANGGSPLRTRFVEADGETYLEALIDVDAAADDLLDWNVEWSSHLHDWIDATSPPQVVSETAGIRTIAIRDNQPLGGRTSRFVRVKIVDHN